MKDATLIITAWRRPRYLERVLASWAAVPEIGDLRRVVAALGQSGVQRMQLDVIAEAGKAMGRDIEVRPDSPECAAVPGEHRALGEAIAAAFADPGCGFVIASSEDVVVSDDVLAYFAWARGVPGRPLAICAHNELGQGWHDQDADDSGADQETVRIRPAFNPWCWGTDRASWERVIEPEWDWDCTSGDHPDRHGWDWQVHRIMNSGHSAVTPDASRARNIGRNEGVYAIPADYPRTVAKSFREHRGEVAYQLVP